MIFCQHSKQRMRIEKELKKKFQCTLEWPQQYKINKCTLYNTISPLLSKPHFCSCSLGSSFSVKHMLKPRHFWIFIESSLSLSLSVFLFLGWIIFLKLDLFWIFKCFRLLKQSIFSEWRRSWLGHSLQKENKKVKYSIKYKLHLILCRWIWTEDFIYLLFIFITEFQFQYESYL